MEWLQIILTHLGPWTPYIIIFILLAIVIISLYGQLGWGSKLFKFVLGKDKSKKRTCTDCIRVILGKTAKFQTRRDILQNNVLKNQMTYAEIKLKEFELYLIQDYKSQLYQRRTPTSNLCIEHKEFLLYQETLLNACETIKSEIRRSFKENGFHELTGTEYSSYVKSKAEALISIGRQYIMSRYPFEGMIIPLDDRFEMLDKASVSDYTNSIYGRAKEIRLDADREIAELDSKYEKEITEFIGE